MPQALLRDSPACLRDACACLEARGVGNLSINLARAERLRISNEMFWSCGAFLMRLSGADEGKVKRALNAVLATGWSEGVAAFTGDAVPLAQSFARQAGLVMLVAGGRTLGVIGGAA